MTVFGQKDEFADIFSKNFSENYLQNYFGFFQFDLPMWNNYSIFAL